MRPLLALEDRDGPLLVPLNRSSFDRRSWEAQSETISTSYLHEHASALALRDRPLAYLHVDLSSSFGLSLCCQTTDDTARCITGCPVILCISKPSREKRYTCHWIGRDARNGQSVLLAYRKHIQHSHQCTATQRWATSSRILLHLLRFDALSKRWLCYIGLTDFLL